MSNPKTSSNDPEHRLIKSVHLRFQAPIPVSWRTFRGSNIKKWALSEIIAPNHRASNVSAWGVLYSATNQLQTLRSISISGTPVWLAAFKAAACEDSATSEDGTVDLRLGSFALPAMVMKERGISNKKI